jgi:hypothetical protein
MTADLRFPTRLSLGLVWFLFVAVTAGPRVFRSTAPQQGSAVARSVRLVVKADKERYSPHDTIELSVALRNDGDSTVYVDTRMFWGYSGGLQLEIRDQQGKEVPPKMQDDAIMPPAPEGDTTILNRLDQAFFYGTRRKLPINEHFRGPGTYKIRVRYKSWLRKEEVETQLRNLPAIWGDSPAIDSDPISVVIVP